MDLPDITVLIYAHREDSPEHDRYAAWLRAMATSAAPFAVSSFTLAGFLRIVTNLPHPNARAHGARVL